MRPNALELNKHTHITSPSHGFHHIRPLNGLQRASTGTCGNGALSRRHVRAAKDAGAQCACADTQRTCAHMDAGQEGRRPREDATSSVRLKRTRAKVCELDTNFEKSVPRPVGTLAHGPTYGSLIRPPQTVIVCEPFGTFFQKYAQISTLTALYKI